MVLLVAFSSCNSQINTQKSKKTNNKKIKTMERINLTIFNEQQVGGHVRFTNKDGSVVEQWVSVDKYYLEETTLPNSNYSIYKMFFYDTKTLQVIGKQFYRMQIETWKKYDKGGNEIEITDYEKPFRISIKELDSKMKKMKIDIMLPNTSVSVLRSTEPNPTYTVITAATPENDMDKRFITIDGLNGSVLSDKIVPRNK